ncbi:MAG: hypothetical protein ACI84C_001472 [Flavobacteriales bacterium]|jgi:hypothetical protein
MFRSTLFLATVSIFVIGCTPTPAPAPMGFQGDIGQRHASLRLLLSEQFQLAPESNPSDVSTYSVDFDRTTKESTIINRNSKDTVYCGKASRNGGLWLMEYDQGNGSYFIGALKVKNNHLVGWGQVTEQMKIIEDQVKDGTLQYLIASRSGANNTLSASQKILTPIFEDILGLLKNETLLIGVGKNQAGGNDSGEEEDMGTFIRKVHPNPADKYFEIDLRSTGDFIVQVIDIEGIIAAESSMTSNEMSIDCSAFAEGDYNVVIRNASDKKELGSKMLTVSR